MHISSQKLLSMFLHNDIKKWCLSLSIFMFFWSPFSGGARSGMIILSVLGIYLLANKKYIKNIEIPIKRWGIVYLALLLPMIFSLVNTINTVNTLEAIAWFLLIFFSGISILYGLYDESYQKFFPKAMIAIVLLWIHISIIQLIFWPSFLPTSPQNRISGLFYDLHQGMILLIITPIAYFFLLDAKKNLLGAYLLLMSCFVTVLSGSRIYLYMIILSLLLYLLTNTISLKKSLCIGISLIAIIMVTFFANESLIKTKLSDSLQVFNPKFSTFDKFDRSLSGRLTLWSTGITMFRSSPITGIGAKNYRYGYPFFSNEEGLFQQFRKPEEFPSHSHNIYIQCLSELGLLGLISLIYIMFMSFLWYKNSNKSGRKKSWVFIFPLLIIFFPLNSTQPILTPWLFPLILVFYLGFIVSLGKSEITNKN